MSARRTHVAIGDGPLRPWTDHAAELRAYEAGRPEYGGLSQKQVDELRVIGRAIARTDPTAVININALGDPECPYAHENFDEQPEEN
jgi:hypothetical protein